MNIYQDYTNAISNIVAKRENLSKGIGSTNDFNNWINEQLSLNGKIEEIKPLKSLEDFILPLRLRPFPPNLPLGRHPDFSHLYIKNTSEYHYIVSVFIDIKNSTLLFKNYSPDVVFMISNIIQKAAIHTCYCFEGYIQRLQGDGVFVYFGGKNRDKKDAIDKALTANSLFTYFVQNDIKKLFKFEDVENINTRIGIDFGDDNDIFWSKAGLGNSSEITTCGLHTSLAAKMQSYAKSNGIVVGSNIVEKTNIKKEFFMPNKEKRYIFDNYTQYDFNWLQYLKSLPYIGTNPMTGELFIKSNIANPIKSLPNLIPNIKIDDRPYLPIK